MLVGYGGSAAIGSDVMDVGWKWGAPRRLLSFAIDGTAVLPPTAPPTFNVAAVDDPKIRLNAADVEAGRFLYQRCAFCHGRQTVAVGAPGPDLRESQSRSILKVSVPSCRAAP